jgi:leader peptidase (prepilin peptidase) / N-methyltransferase
MTTFIYLTLTLFGLTAGSFAGATIWRLRAHQLVNDKKSGEEVDKIEYKKLQPLIKSIKKDRSQCLSCHHSLAWYDLLPLVSWLSTKGKCRYCKKDIGSFEPVIELSMAALFCISYFLWPYDLSSTLSIVQLVVWLVSIVTVVILFVYDLRWMILPLPLTITYGILGIVFAGLQVAITKDTSTLNLLSIVWSVLLLGGLYFVLYKISSGRWVGGGDYKLGIGLGLFLGSWLNAFVALFLANLIGCLIVIPAMLAKKLSKNSSVPLGPLLILGSLITFFFASHLTKLLGISLIF